MEKRLTTSCATRDFLNRRAAHLEERRLQHAIALPRTIAAAGSSDQVGDAILAGLCALMRKACAGRTGCRSGAAPHPRRRTRRLSEIVSEARWFFSENGALSFFALFVQTARQRRAGLMNVLQGHVHYAALSPQALLRVTRLSRSKRRSSRSPVRQVAALMGVPVRTLNQRLDREERSFQTMLGEIEYCRTCWKILLVRSARSQFLGYQGLGSR